MAQGGSLAGRVAVVTGAVLARELAPDNITVNAIAPGPIASAMTTNLAQSLRALIPVGLDGADGGRGERRIAPGGRRRILHHGRDPGRQWRHVGRLIATVRIWDQSFSDLDRVPAVPLDRHGAALIPPGDGVALHGLRDWLAAAAPMRPPVHEYMLEADKAPAEEAFMSEQGSGRQLPYPCSALPVRMEKQCRNS